MKGEEDMKEFLINLLLTILGCILLFIYFKIGVFIIESSLFSSLKRIELNCLSFVLLFSYIFVIPLVLILLKKIKELILS